MEFVCRLCLLAGVAVVALGTPDLRAQTLQTTVPGVNESIPLPVLVDRVRQTALAQGLLPLVSISDKETRLGLDIGGDDTDALYWTGSTRYALVTLENRGTDEQRDILVMLRGARGAIQAVQGAALRWRTTEHGWIAAIPAIAAGERVMFDVTYLLSGKGDGRSGLRNEMQVIAKPRAGNSLQATLAWNAEDCLPAVSQRLAPLKADPGRNARDALGFARTREKDLPKRWLFRFKDKGLDKELRAAASTAARLRQSGGVDGALFSDDFKWTTGRISRDLDNYLKQPVSQAMCAPAGPMLDYLQKRAAPLERRIAAIVSQRNIWRQFARNLVRDTLGTLAEQRVAAREAVVAMPLKPAALGDNWHDVIVQLAAAGALQQDEIVQAETPLRALQKAALAFGDQKTKRKASDEQAKRDSAVRHAFGAIEIALYLELGAERMEALQHAFIDSLADIRQANAEDCRCRY